MEPDAPHIPDSPTAPWWKSVSGLVMCGFLLVAGFYLVTEHTAHLWGVLPFLLILACPLMHVFHHHGHGKHPSVAPPSPGGQDMPRTGGA
jgi:hypothetical protein